ncbi:hypothetical protein N7486_005004 [Penicillium sp. IBT 16267x]|nr:hypothetical protein N7486_005004 [Penicillium sp. IBT 16267x]
MVDAFHNESGLVSTALRPIRKKFAKPPVKVACLPCVSTKAENALTYLANGVGLVRRSKGPPRRPEEEAPQQDGAQYAAISVEFEEPPEMFTQIDVLSLPGAGLRHLDSFQQVSSIFQGYFAGDADPAHAPLELMPSPLTGAQCYVRTYGSEPEILNAYYDFIHRYFPILPPRVAPQCRDRPLQCPVSCADPSSEPLMMYRPQSPLSLAISAVLALIPHPNDPDSSSSASLIQRRTYANAFAQLANTAIETECDLDLSSTDPGQALSTPRPSITRERLHPPDPRRFGNSSGFTNSFRSLHDYVEEDEFCEARRRAWWMTYYCVIQGAIVSTTPPTLVINDPQFTIPYPRFESDAEGWSILIQSQQVLVSATQFISDLNKSLASQSSLHYMFERMQQLDSWTNSVLAQTDILPITSHEPDFGDCRETITAQCIRAMARIKLSSAQIKTHRFRAFSDIPIFVKRHCDLTCAHATNVAQVPTPKSSGTGINSVSCECTSLDQFQRAPSAEYMTPSDSSTSSDIHPSIPQYPQYPVAPGFPYSTQHSAKICLRAAVLISRLFESLPYPQPLPETHQQPHQRGGLLPRTMPSLACCLMQSSYAMLMVFYKARVANQMSPDVETELVSDSTDRLVKELRQGLRRIIGAVSNYSLAFEALDGMRDEIQGAYQTAFPPNTAI